VTAVRPWDIGEWGTGGGGGGGGGARGLIRGKGRIRPFCPAPNDKN